MKKIVTLLAALFSFAAVFAAPTITGVTAQQRYPWNGKVDISYTVNGDIAAHCSECSLIPSLKVTATDKSASKTYTATSLSGDTKLTAGTHKIVWNMDAQGLSFKSEDVVFDVACETTEAMYCVIDLSAGADATRYPVTYLAAEPSGGFNIDVYKTTKMVLRKIKAGSNAAGGSMPKDMWVGIFEVTQKQWLLVGMGYPIGYDYTNWHYTKNDKYPIQSVGYSSYEFRTKLSSKCGLSVRKPTFDEWEYACRSGHTSDLNNGTALTLENANKVAFWGISVSGATAYNKYQNGAAAPISVGLYKPNDWGLYDMHGNVSEEISCNRGHGHYIAGGSPYSAAGGSMSSSLENLKPNKESVGENNLSDAGLRVFAEAL